MKQLVGRMEPDIEAEGTSVVVAYYRSHRSGKRRNLQFARNKLLLVEFVI
jgi:hypothetical protein